MAKVEIKKRNEVLEKRGRVIIIIIINVVAEKRDPKVLRGYIIEIKISSEKERPEQSACIGSSTPLMGRGGGGGGADCLVFPGFSMSDT